MANERRVRIGEAARAIGISPDTLKRWARRGRVRCWRGPGGVRFFELAEVLAEMPVSDNPRDDDGRPVEGRP